MMSKDSVKKRIGSEAKEGMSFTEFSYQLVQGTDFLHLYNNYNCKLQMGGSDQWGNIVTGTNLSAAKQAEKPLPLPVRLLQNLMDQNLAKQNQEMSGSILKKHHLTSFTSSGLMYRMKMLRNILKYLPFWTGRN